MKQDWVAIGDRVRRAIVEDGFLQIALQEPDIVGLQSLQNAMMRFYSSSESHKLVYRDKGSDFGWTPSFEEPAYQPGTVASLESFDISSNALRGSGSPAWPQEPGFRPGAEALWQTYTELGHCVLELLARTTGIRSDFFAKNCDSQELNSLRLLHYPAQAEKAADHEVGIAAHTDFECITLLYQSAPGLEIRKPDANWIKIPAQPGKLIILFGDMLERWTNGEIQATGHRVCRSVEERYSIVMFVAANKGLKVAPLPNFTGADRPARYDAIEQSSHIEREIARAIKQRMNP